MLPAFLQERRHRAKIARDLYHTVAVQSREPFFYEKLGVPDTLDGRYDMLVIHVALLLRRLTTFAPGDKPTRKAPLPRLAQRLFDLMEKNLKESIRAVGVQEMGITRENKKMIRAFYGRAYSYETGLREHNLETPLRENLYRNSPEVTESQVSAMAAYVVREAEALRVTPENVFLAGLFKFGAPDGGGSRPKADPTDASAAQETNVPNPLSPNTSA